MEAYTYKLEQILTPERRYIIPTFQRDYEWTETGQWQLLFEDLDAVAGRLWQAREHAKAVGISPLGAEKRLSPHFLGAIVCDQLPSPAGGIDLRAVIDGQQRLTTLQLMVRGVLDVLVERGSPRASKVRRLLENPADVISAEYEVHKLWPRRKDREVWPVAMADTHPAQNDHLYLKARKYFADATRAAAGDGATDRLDDLVDALLGMFKLVVIDLDENDDAQVIFEVLNGRQTPLSASDLVKNLLFLRGELSGEKELEKLYDAYWADFDEAWWKKEVGTGHAARARRDVLLSVWLTAVSGDEASGAHLYGEIRTYLNANDRKTEDLLSELHSYGQAYKEIYAAPQVKLPTAMAEPYERLVRLKITTAMPLLTWLRTLPDAQLDEPDHVRAIRAVESWVLRRMVNGANTRGYGAAFVQVLHSAQKAAKTPGANIADAVVAELASSPNSLAWPTDDEVITAFGQRQYYDAYTQERIRLLLGSIDAQMQIDNHKAPQAVFDYNTLQIEHVMPRGWKDHWPLSDEQESDPMAEVNRNTAVHRIGNLTLVTSSFNQSVSNHAWTEKKPEFEKQTKLELNRAVSQTDQWNEAAAAVRALGLAEVACRVWPNPAALGYALPQTADGSSAE